jgi:alcohol-forming fatty acyl-CoA reductase
MIAESLSGKRIVVTGGTGFLGTALIERLLRQVPDCTVGALVRPGRRGAADRVRREIIRNDCFDRLRREWGDDFESRVAARLTAIAGDVGVDGLGLDEEGRVFVAGADIVVHSAAAVAFDSPLDQAVEVNLLGPVRVVRTLRETNPSAHLVAVSTAYVAGTRRGKAFETTLDRTPYAPEVSWRAEVSAARRSAGDLDAASRTPSRLEELHKRARRELGPAGIPLLAERTEKLRQEWVKDRLVEAGIARASSLGWPDAYPYTKALGERAML